MTSTGNLILRILLITMMVYSVGFVLAGLIVWREESCPPEARRLAYVAGVRAESSFLGVQRPYRQA